MIFFLNLPKEIMFMDGSYIHYTYDAAGTLLRKGYYVGEEEDSTVIDYGVSIRQLSRMTGVSYGIIQRINRKNN